jgi:hypothetical protein
MCEILVRAFDSHAPTVAEWRTYLSAHVPDFTKFVADYADVPVVEANAKRLEKYLDARNGLASVQRREQKTGRAVLTPEQRAALLAIIAEYESGPLTAAEVDKIRVYFHESTNDLDQPIASIVVHWKYRKHTVAVEALRTDADKGAELALKDERACYKSGDPVVVMPDGHEWGLEERLPKFYVVKIPGITVEAARKWVATWKDEADPDKPVIMRRRLYGVNVASLPASIRNTLQTTGTVTVTLNQIRNYIVNKQTGAAD